MIAIMQLKSFNNRALIYTEIYFHVYHKSVSNSNTTNQKYPIANILNAYRKQIPTADAKNIYEYIGCE